MIYISGRKTIFSDFNRDGVKDRATLKESDGECKLTVTISANPKKGTPKQTSEVVVVMESLKGSDASMSVNKKNGSLRVNTDSGSREVSSRTATFAYRGGQMVLAGVKSAVTDTGDENLPTTTYDYNLRTGHGWENGKPVNFVRQTVPMEQYDPYADVVVVKK